MRVFDRVFKRGQNVFEVILIMAQDIKTQKKVQQKRRLLCRLTTEIVSAQKRNLTVEQNLLKLGRQLPIIQYTLFFLVGELNKLVTG